MLQLFPHSWKTRFMLKFTFIQNLVSSRNKLLFLLQYALYEKEKTMDTFPLFPSISQLRVGIMRWDWRRWSQSSAENWHDMRVVGSNIILNKNAICEKIIWKELSGQKKSTSIYEHFAYFASGLHCLSSLNSSCSACKPGR